jgi:hypothetical protein
MLIYHHLEPTDLTSLNKIFIFNKIKMQIQQTNIFSGEVDVEGT